MDWRHIMRFRPCIDIHNGKVKQIVGSSLNDNDNSLVENFVSDMKSEDYASMYMEDDLKEKNNMSSF